MLVRLWRRYLPRKFAVCRAGAIVRCRQQSRWHVCGGIVELPRRRRCRAPFALRRSRERSLPYITRAVLRMLVLGEVRVKEVCCRHIGSCASILDGEVEKFRRLLRRRLLRPCRRPQSSLRPIVLLQRWCSRHTTPRVLNADRAGAVEAELRPVSPAHHSNILQFSQDSPAFIF